MNNRCTASIAVVAKITQAFLLGLAAHQTCLSTTFKKREWDISIIYFYYFFDHYDLQEAPFVFANSTLRSTFHIHFSYCTQQFLIT